MNTEVPFEEVENFDDIDTRVSAVGCLFPNIIGVNENTIEWCPNNEPPSTDEYSAWLWVIKPSLGTEILEKCDDELSKLIRAYDSDSMESWFEYIST
ncbi:MAG: hypothetical protein P8Y24_13885 [Gammaproteobacteria bacterium]